MEPPVAVGQVLVGKYRVEKVLGSGGMGVVVAAWHLELEQRVAVKFLHPLAAERGDATERFRREARAAAKIRSEHVARVIDVGTFEGGYPYMVMEYLEGQDLANELRARGPLPIAETTEYILQTIEALAEAHAAGVVHRDLKPANLFVARRPDGSQCIKVLDFGISKALLGGSLDELALTKTASLIGSPLYMAPEQMRSAKDVDTRADIWSLGAILYEVMTGRPPYTGESIPQLCASLLNDVPTPLRQLRPEIPERLDRAVMRCLEKERGRRFPTVSDLARELIEFAPAAGRIHADRASKVLGATDITLSADRSAQSLAVSVGAPTDRVPPEYAAGLAEQRAFQPADPTVNSWGGSGAEIPQPKSKRWLVFGAAGFFISVCVALGIAAGSRVDPEEPRAATPVTPPVAASTVEQLSPEPPAEPATVDPAAALAVPSVTPGPSVQKPSAKAPASPKSPVRPAGAKPVEVKSQGGSSTISDFGGRR